MTAPLVAFFDLTNCLWKNSVTGNKKQTNNSPLFLFFFFFSFSLREMASSEIRSRSNPYDKWIALVLFILAIPVRFKNISFPSQVV